MLSSINLQNSPQYSYTKCHYQRTAVCPLGPLLLDLWDTAHTSLDILFQTCWPGNTELLGWNLLTELILHQWYSIFHEIQNILSNFWVSPSKFKVFWESITAQFYLMWWEEFQNITVFLLLPQNKRQQSGKRQYFKICNFLLENK